MSEVSCLLLKCLVFSCDCRKGISYVGRMPCSVAVFAQKLMGTSGDHQGFLQYSKSSFSYYTSCSEQGLTGHMPSQVLSISKGRGSTASLSNLCQGLATLTERKDALVSLSRISCISVCAHGSVFAALPHQAFKMRSPEPSALQAGQSQLFLSPHTTAPQIPSTSLHSL